MTQPLALPQRFGAMSSPLLYESLSRLVTKVNEVIAAQAAWEQQVQTSIDSIGTDLTTLIGQVAAITATPSEITVAADLNLNGGVLKVDGVQVVGPQQPTVAATTVMGGDMDSDARTAINDIIARLQAHGLIA
jgi:hypothetical protein